MKSASLEGVPTAAAAGVGGSTEGSWTDAVAYRAFPSCAQREEKCEGEWNAPGIMAIVGCAGVAIGCAELAAKKKLGSVAVIRGGGTGVDASVFKPVQDRMLK